MHRCKSLKRCTRSCSHTLRGAEHTRQIPVLPCQKPTISPLKLHKLDLAVKRMQRYGEFLERLISPEGTFPAFGRSIVYRLAAFQPLSLLALNNELPKTLPPGQVRTALTAVMKRMYSVAGNVDLHGYLQIGLAGHQPDAANYYTNNGSLYITSLVFLALGLPADDEFWTAPAADWTNKKAWSGAAFPPDKKIKY